MTRYYSTVTTPGDGLNFDPPLQGAGARNIQTSSTSFVLTADPVRSKTGPLRGSVSVNALVADAAKTAKEEK